MPPLLSRRARLDTTPHAFARAVEARRHSGAELLDLTETNPTLVGLPFDDAAVLAALQHPEGARYHPEARGLAVAREAVARHLTAHGTPVSAEQVVLGAGTSELYAHLLTSLADPGERVLVPSPSYPLLDELARYTGVELVPYPLAYDGGWHVDLGALRRLAVGARAVVAISPNNPTGNALSEGERVALAGLGLPLIVDEVFRAYPLEGVPPPLLGLGAGAPLSVSLGGLSKQAALPGLKLAWAVLDGEPAAVSAVGEALERWSDTFLSVATPVQRALPELLTLGAPRAALVRQRLRTSLGVLREAFSGSPVQPLHVEAGWSALLRLPALPVGVEDGSPVDWSALLLEHGVLVQPGWYYDLPFAAAVVVSLLTPTHTLREGAQRLRAVVEARAHGAPRA